MLLSPSLLARKNTRHLSKRRPQNQSSGVNSVNCKNFKICSLSHGLFHSYDLFLQDNPTTRQHCWNIIKCSASKFFGSRWIPWYDFHATKGFWCLRTAKNQVSIIAMFSYNLTSLLGWRCQRAHLYRGRVVVSAT